jgi:hypothetical protein
MTLPAAQLWPAAETVFEVRSLGPYSQSLLDMIDLGTNGELWETCFPGILYTNGNASCQENQESSFFCQLHLQPEFPMYKTSLYHKRTIQTLSQEKRCWIQPDRECEIDCTILHLLTEFFRNAFLIAFTEIVLRVCLLRAEGSGKGGRRPPQTDTSLASAQMQRSKRWRCAGVMYNLIHNLKDKEFWWCRGDPHRRLFWHVLNIFQ